MMFTGHLRTMAPAARRVAGALLRRAALVVLILSLPVTLGAWRDIIGKSINPRFVERIENGQTTKHEILLWFGDPEKVERTPEGPVFRYVSYKDAPPPSGQEPQQQSTSPYYLDEKKQVKRLTPKTKGEIVRSTLTIRFTADGETVLSHDYKEFDDKP
jgi:outer membrane protein assembly factor BamE (lipoprotein component of BamABCDE complex)